MTHDELTAGIETGRIPGPSLGHAPQPGQVTPDQVYAAADESNRLGGVAYVVRDGQWYSLRHRVCNTTGDTWWHVKTCRQPSTTARKQTEARGHVRDFLNDMDM